MDKLLETRFDPDLEDCCSVDHTVVCKGLVIMQVSLDNMSGKHIGRTFLTGQQM
jgi:hypothetical protein